MHLQGFSEIPLSYPWFYPSFICFFLQRGKFSFHATHWGAVSCDAQNLVALCLTFDARKRPTAAALLGHPWFASLRKRAVLMSPPLPQSVANLRVWRARRRWKITIAVVVACHRFRVASHVLADEDSVVSVVTPHTSATDVRNALSDALGSPLSELSPGLSNGHGSSRLRESPQGEKLVLFSHVSFENLPSESPFGGSQLSESPRGSNFFHGGSHPVESPRGGNPASFFSGNDNTRGGGVSALKLRSSIDLANDSAVLLRERMRQRAAANAHAATRNDDDGKTILDGDYHDGGSVASEDTTDKSGAPTPPRKSGIPAKVVFYGGAILANFDDEEKDEEDAWSLKLRSSVDRANSAALLRERMRLRAAANAAAAEDRVDSVSLAGNNSSMRLRSASGLQTSHELAESPFFVGDQSAAAVGMKLAPDVKGYLRSCLTPKAAKTRSLFDQRTVARFLDIDDHEESVAGDDSSSAKGVEQLDTGIGSFASNLRSSRAAPAGRTSPLPPPAADMKSLLRGGVKASFDQRAISRFLNNDDDEGSIAGDDSSIVGVGLLDTGMGIFVSKLRSSGAAPAGCTLLQPPLPPPPADMKSLLRGGVKSSFDQRAISRFLDYDDDDEEEEGSVAGYGQPSCSDVRSLLRGGVDSDWHSGR